MARLGRFLLVGCANTLVGYAVIVLGIELGAGDYLANAAGYAIGLALSYCLNRRFTFTMTSRAEPREVGSFGAAVLIAYALNVAVIFVARQMGHVDDPLVQAGAMAAYSLALFLLSRFWVFRTEPAGRAQA